MADDNKKNSAVDQLIEDTTRGQGAAPAQPAAGAQGIASAHNPGGMAPGSKPGAGFGSMGTGGASTGGSDTGTVKRGES
ncbi:hypothetical protein MHZ93_14175 [Roseomonas sp. ACRSG]|nr:hypothetical protein [Roseomonas sp. ACRSG]